jgi:hypothetical protein
MVKSPETAEEISLQAHCTFADNTMMVLQSKTLVSYVPTARLAQLLVVARGGMGIPLDEMSDRFEGRFTVFQLMQLEAAILPINDEDLRAIARAYGLDYSLFAPGRGELHVDLAASVMSMGETDSTFEPGSSATEVLIRYLALLYNLRLSKPGDELVLRDPDLEALAKTFDRPVAQIEHALRHLMTNNAAEIRTQVKALTKRPSFLQRLLA